MPKSAASADASTRVCLHHTHVCSSEKLSVFGLPDGLGEIVAATALAGRSVTPGQARKTRTNFGAEIGGHAHQLAQIHQLSFAMLRDGAAEIVVASHRIDLDALIGGEFAQLLTKRAFSACRAGCHGDACRRSPRLDIRISWRVRSPAQRSGHRHDTRPLRR